jgi:hypothetical protein
MWLFGCGIGCIKKMKYRYAVTHLGVTFSS